MEYIEESSDPIFVRKKLSFALAEIYILHDEIYFTCNSRYTRCKEKKCKKCIVNAKDKEKYKERLEVLRVHINHLRLNQALSSEDLFQEAKLYQKILEVLDNAVNEVFDEIIKEGYLSYQRIIFIKQLKLEKIEYEPAWIQSPLSIQYKHYTHFFIVSIKRQNLLIIEGHKYHQGYTRIYATLAKEIFECSKSCIVNAICRSNGNWRLVLFEEIIQEDVKNTDLICYLIRLNIFNGLMAAFALIYSKFWIFEYLKEHDKIGLIHNRHHDDTMFRSSDTLLCFLFKHLTHRSVYTKQFDSYLVMFIGTLYPDIKPSMTIHDIIDSVQNRNTILSIYNWMFQQ